MADIFVSYASADREKAEELARILIAKGWSVFWDRNIPAGRKFRDVIESELTESRCVIVLWSRESVRSHWVCDEAEEARKLEKFLPVLIESVRPPLGFRDYQNVDLSDWSMGSAHSGITRLLTQAQRAAPLAAAAYKPNRETTPLPSVSGLAPVSGDLFPLFGVTLGKTTVDEIARLGQRTPSIDESTGEPYHCYRVLGCSFWYNEETSVVNSIYIRRRESMPGKWAELGFSWEKSSSEWFETLRRLGFSVDEPLWAKLDRMDKISASLPPIMTSPSKRLAVNPRLSPEFLLAESKLMRAKELQKKQADQPFEDTLQFGYQGLLPSPKPEKSPTTPRKATARRLAAVPLEISLFFGSDDKLDSLDVKSWK